MVISLIVLFTVFIDVSWEITTWHASPWFGNVIFQPFLKICYWSKVVHCSIGHIASDASLNVADMQHWMLQIHNVCIFACYIRSDFPFCSICCWNRMANQIWRNIHVFQGRLMVPIHKCLSWLVEIDAQHVFKSPLCAYILDDVLFQNVHSLPNCFQVQNGGHPSINWTFQKHPFVILKKWFIVGKYVGFFVFQFVLFVVFVFRVLGICCLDVLSVWSGWFSPCKQEQVG